MRQEMRYLLIQLNIGLRLFILEYMFLLVVTLMSLTASLMYTIKMQ